MAMTNQQRIEAIEYAIKWVESSDAFDSYENEPKNNAIAILEEALRETNIRNMANNLVDRWSNEHPNIKKTMLRAEAIKAARRWYKKDNIT